MIVLLSGEGPTDCGTRDRNGSFKPGPMACFVDRLLEPLWQFSVLEMNAVEFLSESELTLICRKMDKALVLPGKKRKEAGTAYYFKNARGLAKRAREREQEEGCPFMAILFRDSDGTRSTRKGLWQEKWESVNRGFLAEGFDCGVPMVPNPKSEAWLLCALQEHPYNNCARWEKLSGNDKSPKSAKGVLTQKLDNAFGCGASADEINDLLDAGKVQPTQIQMPSFDAFRKRLEEVGQEMLSKP